VWAVIRSMEFEWSGGNIVNPCKDNSSFNFRLGKGLPSDSELQRFQDELLGVGFPPPSGPLSSMWSSLAPTLGPVMNERSRAVFSPAFLPHSGFRTERDDWL
jgi:hypothetical protein